MKKPSDAIEAVAQRTPTPATQAATWAREIFWAADSLSARTVQKHIGPSEVGDPCDRAVASKVQGTPPTRYSPGGNMASISGTGIHAWISDRISTLFGGTNRYLIETGVEYRGVSGTADLFDRREHRVIDWKTKSRDAARRFKAKPEWLPSWIVQTNIYGAGMVARGEHVEEVGIIIVPREGNIDEISALVRPFEMSVADRAIDRLERLRTVDPESLPACALPYCEFCPRP
jgi:hypothetical protein